MFDFNKFMGNKIKFGSYDRQNYFINHILPGCGKCLDVGSATVELIRKGIINKGYKYYNIDLRKGINSAQANVENIPFKDNSFDILLMSCVIGYVYDWKQSLKECCRIIKTSGIFYFYESVDYFSGDFKYIPLEKQSNKIKFPGGDFHGYVNSVSIEKIIEECDNNGFDLIKLNVRFDYMDSLIIMRKR